MLDHHHGHNNHKRWLGVTVVMVVTVTQLLIERMVIGDGGLEIVRRDNGWQELAVELMPGTIGAELQEWEQMEEAV